MKTPAHVRVDDVWAFTRSRLESFVRDLAGQLDSDDETDDSVQTLKQLELACKVVKLLPETDSTVDPGNLTVLDDAELERRARA